MLIPEVAERVQFKGYVPRAKLPGILARAAVCVYPSHMEAMPVAWLEGLAMGRPVVASAAGPGPEIIEDGVCGLLCDPHDPSSIADCLLRVLTNRELQARLGAAGRKRVEECYSLDALVSRNVAFYRECLKNGNRP
jgi:glycosyltransferase involved in cell wall biosynthesis